MKEFNDNIEENSEKEFSQENVNEIEEEQSSIFDAPAEHKRARARSSKMRIAIVIAASFVLAAIIVGFLTYKEDDKGGFTIFWIHFDAKTDTNQEFDNPTNTQATKEIEVVNVSSDKFAAVTVTNKNGSFNLYWKLDENKEKIWCVEGMDNSLTSSQAIEYVAANAGAISARRVIEGRNESDCGFDAPQAKIDVVMNDGSNAYTVTIGAASADKTGTYLKFSGDEKIYLVKNDYAKYFSFELINLADTSDLSAVQYDMNNSSYFDGEKILTTFDKITVSGKAYDRDIVIVPNTVPDQSGLIPFMVSSPYNRYADNVDSLVTMFTSGVDVVGSYSYDTSAASLKKYGLDNPDAVITAKIGTITKVFKLSVVDDEYCAIIDESKGMIKTVAISTVPFVLYEESDFYSDWVCMEIINQLSSFEVKTGDAQYKFGIAYDSTQSDNQSKYTIIRDGGKTISTGLFQEFYQFFVGIKTADYEIGNVSGSPAATVTLVFSKDASKKEYAFYKVSDAKYQYSVNGVMMGRISATNYNKLISNVKLIAENKAIVP